MRRGIDLVDPEGLPVCLTKTVLETALEAELSEQLGYDSTIMLAVTEGN